MKERYDIPRITWGVGLSAQQAEGEEGRLYPSSWDVFARTPGNIADGSTFKIASDHYNRYKEDFGILEVIGAQAYRYSFSMPRIYDHNTEKLIPEGVDFYEKYLTDLQEREVPSWMTFNWWDLAHELEEQGGWPRRDTAYIFADYVYQVSDRLGPLIDSVFTINEPTSILHGYYPGTDAPGRNSFPDALQAAHHLLLGHGLAVQAVRATMGEETKVGIPLSVVPVRPLDPKSEADRLAAWRYDGYHNRLWLDPLYRKQYPEDMFELFGDAAPKVREGDFDIIASRTDFIGINYYDLHFIKYSEEETGDPLKLVRAKEEEVLRHYHYDQSELGWLIDEKGLAEVIDRVRNEYNVPAIVISEIGAGSNKEQVVDGRVYDQQRIDFLRRHLPVVIAKNEELMSQNEEGDKALAFVIALFVWALTDNKEWPQGEDVRFGLAHINYETLERIVKDSAYDYGDFIKENTVPSPMDI